MNNVIFFLFWIVANLIGFILGSYLGATNDGLITSAVTGIPGLMLGDLIFGAMIGLCQWLVFRFTKFMKVNPWWIVLTSLGFLCGARIGSVLTYRLVTLHEWLEPSLIFGIFMGGSIGVATCMVLRRSYGWKQAFWWVGISVLAWIFGEGVAFNAYFSQNSVPIVALIISGLTGLELVRFQYFASKQKRAGHNEVSLPGE